MFSNNLAELSLNAPSRCVTSVKNDTRNHRFIVGTCSVSVGSENDQDYTGVNTSSSPLYLLRYHEEMNELAIDAQLNFGTEDGGSNEVWSCSSCPFASNLIVTCRGDGETALWKIPDDALREDELDFYPDEDDFGNDTSNRNEDINKSMDKIENLELGGGRVTDMQWNPGCLPTTSDSFDEHHGNIDTGNDQFSGANLLTVQSGKKEVCVTTWNIESAAAIQLDQIAIPIPNERGVMPNPPKASWDPHNHNLCAVTIGSSIAMLDLRSPLKVVNGIKSCHKFGVTDVDYNPNKIHVLASSGQDALVKFWDLRFTASYENHDPDHDLSNSSSWSRHTPLRTLRGGHFHWATSVKYNSFHDQLLLSGGTDGMVNLWRISSISSAPLLDLGVGGAVRDFVGVSQSSDMEGNSSENINPVITYEKDDLLENASVEDDGSVDTDGGNAPDVRVTKMEMREAVYDLTWSAADPWVYVSLGYDGNVVLNHVSSKEKYKILL